MPALSTQVKVSGGEGCDMTLKNNIEGIIIKWAYQCEEVRENQSSSVTDEIFQNSKSGAPE